MILIISHSILKINDELIQTMAINNRINDDTVDIENVYYTKNKICEIHNTIMPTEKVRITYTTTDFYQSSYFNEIRVQLFPNCDDPVRYAGGSSGCTDFKRYMIRNVCKGCNNDRTKWIEENLESLEMQYHLSDLSHK
jgi:hypothetical protein